MNEVKKDGGQAFPCHFNPWSKEGHECAGMSLRDWFAGMAIQGYAGIFGLSIDEEKAAKCALGAYILADAMLAARDAATGEKG